MPRRKKEKLIGLGLPANLLREFIDLSYKGNTSIAPENYDIDAELSDSRVKVYAKKGSNDKNIVIVHRGSVGKQDWFDNIDYFLRGNVKNTKSFKLHQERQRKAVEKYGGENMIGVGHSRAGLYLQQLQKDPETKLNEIITYNKAVGFYDALRTNPEEQTDVKVKNDFVSLLSGLQKRKNKMVEIDATSNPLDFNKAHQAEEISKLGDTFIGKKEEEKLEGSGRAPTTKTLEQLQKKLKTLEKQLINIEKGKVYKTTNKEKVSYEISYTKARIKNHETKGEDLIITKKAKYKDELPAKAKPYKAKPKKEPKQEEPKKEEPKPEEPKKEELSLLEEPNLNIVLMKMRDMDFSKMSKPDLIKYYKKIAPNHKIEGGEQYSKPQLRKMINRVITNYFEKIKAEQKPEPKKEEPKKEEGKLDFLKLGENYTKMDFITAINNYIRTNNLQSKTNPREFRIDKNLSKLFNIEENKIITYFQSADLFRPTIKELFKEEPKQEPKKEEPKPEPKKEEPKPEPKKEEPKPEPKKEEPKPKPPKLKKQQAFLLGYKEIKEEPKKEVKKEPKQQETKAKPAIKTKAMLLQEFENIILNKDADDVGELIKSMGFGNVNLSSQFARQRVFEMIKTSNASKSKKAKKFNIEEFITRFNKENCEDLMCKYGINSKAEFRKWVVKNHPDKGGTIDDADFKQIINCAIKEKYCSKKEGGYFWDSKEVKEEKKAKKIAARETFEKERQERSKARREAIDSFVKNLNEAKKKRKAKGETAPKAEDNTQMAKAEDNTQMAIEEGEPAIEGGIFGFSAEEKARKQAYKERKAAYAKEHHGSTADYVFSKANRQKFDKEYEAKKNKAQQGETAPKAIESTQQGVEEEGGEPAIEGGKLTKKGLAQLSKKELHALNKKYSKAFKGQFSKKHKKKGGGIEILPKMLYSGFANLPESMRIQQEARKVLDGKKIWYLPFWKPADHIFLAEAEALVKQRENELGMEALRDKMSRETGIDLSKMDNNKALGLAFSTALDGLSYTPLGVGASVAASVASQVLDPNLKLEEKEEEKEGGGFFYLKEITEPTNPIFRYKKTYEIPTFIDPETEFLLK